MTELMNQMAVAFDLPILDWIQANLKSDLLDIFMAVSQGKLDSVPVEFAKGEYAACVVEASGGYPQSYEKGKVIHGLDEGGQCPGVTVYHAGTKYENGQFLTSGGRVLGLTATASTLPEALEKAYQAAEKVTFEKMHLRKDIGQRALAAL